MKKMLKLILFFVSMYAVPSCSKTLTPDLIQNFTKPITFTRSGIVSFFNETFNHELYGKLGLPASFVHLKDFIAHGATLDDPYPYLISITQIFHDRLKEATWVNPYALFNIIDSLSQQAPAWSSAQQSDQAAIREVLYNALLSKFTLLKKDPETFMDKVSADIVATLDKKNNKLQQEFARKVSRLLEGALDKVIWDPREGTQCWQSCKQIADRLYDLYELGLIGDEATLNHCYWSLTYRFCYFLETVGQYLPLHTYEAIKYDIATKSSHLLGTQEQEEFIMSKATQLQNTVFGQEVLLRLEKKSGGRPAA